jgi:hypothetical protein
MLQQAYLVSLVKRVNLDGLVWMVCLDSKDLKVIVAQLDHQD